MLGQGSEPCPSTCIGSPQHADMPAAVATRAAQ